MVTTLKTLNSGLRLLVWLIVLAACSIEFTQTVPPPPTAAPPAATAELPPATEAPAVTQAPTEPPTPTPVPWAHQNLSGSLVYTQGVYGLVRLDLATGLVNDLLPPTDNIWLSAAAVSPDGKTIALAYSPPPEDGAPQLGYTSLYEISAQGTAGEPRPLLLRTDPQESYFSPAWSADGQYLYFAHFVPLLSENGNTFRYTIERLAYPPTGAAAPEVIVEDAIWPKLSPDGARLSYLKFDTVTFQLELYMSGLDGQNEAPVLKPGTFPSVDAQFFSPDGKTIVFNAVGETPAPPLAFLDWLMGVRPAGAHNVPSDWWRLELGSSEPPVRLTKLYDTGMYGDFSKDGAHIAFISASGIYVMKPDGADLLPLAPIDDVGTLDWVE